MRDESTRRLIVTADDLGLSARWDEAIIGARDRGVVTSTSIVTTGRTFASAARALRNEGIDHGVHLDLLDGSPLSPAVEIPSLVDQRGGFHTLRALLFRFASGRVRADDVQREWKRQIERALADGLEPTHLNAHFHLHVLPGLFRVAADLATRFAIPWIRLPDEAPWLELRVLRSRPTRFAKTAILWMLSRAQRASATGPALRYADCRAAATSEQEWLGSLLGIRGEVTEIFCHPGQSESETAALMSPAVRRAVDACFRRTSFRDIHDAS